MGDRWWDLLTRSCEAARIPDGPASETVLFYLARWCQKRAGAKEPDPAGFDRPELHETAGRIVRHLAEDGERVERFLDGDRAEMESLHALLLASAARRDAAGAEEHADEAVQKIALVLLTGTPPSLAAERLAAGPDGPSNEYIFTAPFSNWARTVAINHVIDVHRRVKRERAPNAPLKPAPTLARPDLTVLRRAKEALPALIEAIRDLPDVQRDVMVASLRRADVDDVVVECLHAAAPDLFTGDEPRPRSDREIGALMGKTARLVAASRSVARRKLAEADPSWALLLDFLLPHRSTGPRRRRSDA